MVREVAIGVGGLFTIETVTNPQRKRKSHSKATTFLRRLTRSFNNVIYGSRKLMTAI